MKVAAFLSFLSLAFAAPAQVEKRAGPTVVAPSPQATVVGKSFLKVDSFNAIPYAQPPVGQLRLKPPQPLTSSLGTIDGTGSARACPQFFFSVDAANFPTNVIGTLLNTPIFQAVTNAGEDCLTINVQRPAGTKADAKLPVLFWIFGGGFELGGYVIFESAQLELHTDLMYQNGNVRRYFHCSRLRCAGPACYICSRQLPRRRLWLLAWQRNSRRWIRKSRLARPATRPTVGCRQHCSIWR